MPQRGPDGDGADSSPDGRRAPRHHPKGKSVADLSDSFDDRVLGAMLRHAMVAPGDRVLVAVSGGQDSLALLHCLHGLRNALGITLCAAHLHHGMRGQEADADAAFVEGFCEGLGVPPTVERVSVPDLARERGVSIEEAGREARREFLQRGAAREGCRRIAVGHTATDRAETVLMNILRGAGLDGLRGIRPVSGAVIRPLILITRDETAAYCAAHGLQPRLDRTNLDADAYLRNRIRLRLLPLIADEYAPGVEAALVRLADAAEGELGWTDTLVDEAFAAAREPVDEGIGLRLERLARMPEGLLRRVLRRALRELRGDLRGFAMCHIQDLVDLVHGGETGAQCRLPFEVCAQRRYNEIVLLTRHPPGGDAGDWQVFLPVPGSVSLPHGGMMTATPAPLPSDFAAVMPDEAFVAAQAAGDGLIVRAWRDGDRIAPLGMDGSRKLQDLFVDARVPREERRRIPVVINGRGEVLWVAGQCVSREGAVQPGDRVCVHLTWRRGGAADTDGRAENETGD